MKKIDAAPPEVAKPYEPKPRELTAARAYAAAQDERTPRPAIKITTEGQKIIIGPDHPDLAIAHVLLSKAMGTTDSGFINEFLMQLANASGKGPIPTKDGINFLLAVVDGIEPRDQMEAMLAAQMAAVHCATMTFARRLTHVETIQQQDSAERAFNKLARTFAIQLEALKRYRSGGEREVTVQHVHVNEGGQAIVGNVAPIPAGGGGAKNPEAAP